MLLGGGKTDPGVQSTCPELHAGASWLQAPQARGTELQASGTAHA